jgi:type II secretion system protein I
MSVLRRRRGLTLLEILVASILLAIGLLGALEVVGRSAVTSARAQDRARAMLFARSKLEEILKEAALQVGQDQGQGVDETTDYDWEAVIEESAHPSLVVVTVLARNRITGVSVTLSALRRPDLNAPAATDETGAPAGGAGGSPGGGTGATL